MIDNANETIICAAVWYKELPLLKDIPIDTYLPKNIDKGIVFCGHRHGQCIYAKCAITGLRDDESGEQIQGFLTSKNRFVDRQEGAIIHVNNGGKLNYSDNTLYSEDLY